MTEKINWGTEEAPAAWIDMRSGGVSFPTGPIPIILTAVLEELYIGRKHHGVASYIYMQSQLLYRLTMDQRRARLNKEAWPVVLQQKRFGGRRYWTIDNVPVRITKGKDPYYILTNQGRLQ